MTAALQRIGLSLLLTAGLCAGPKAEAGQPKYIYLKVGEGASVYASTSRHACEAARRKHATDWARMIRQMKKNVGNRGTFADEPMTRCLDQLPLGLGRWICDNDNMGRQQLSEPDFKLFVVAHE